MRNAFAFVLRGPVIMTMNVRKVRWCIHCKEYIGYTAKEYCGAACRQAAYRSRKRHGRPARPYSRRPTDQP